MLFLLVASLLVAQGAAKGGPMDTCEAQKNCLKLDITGPNAVPSTSKPPCSGSCLYTVCLSFSYGPNCVKSGGISHTCQKSSGDCQSAANSFVGAAELANWGVNQIQCQTAVGGADVTFLLKDGSGCNAGGASGLTTTINGAAVSCSPRSDPSNSWSVVPSCTGNGEGVECIWKVTLPACSAAPVNPPTTVGTQTCACQNGGKCDASGSCICGTGYTGMLCETLACSSIMADYPDMKVLDSGFGPSCTLEEAAGKYLTPYDCKPEVQGCNVLKCNKPVPAQTMADLQQTCTKQIV